MEKPMQDDASTKKPHDRRWEEWREDAREYAGRAKIAQTAGQIGAAGILYAQAAATMVNAVVALELAHRRWALCQWAKFTRQQLVNERMEYELCCIGEA
jgi:hypothetical protein